MPTQESKAHHVGEWASLRNTSPEIAEAIFEVAKYDEKLAEQIWEEGNDEVLVRAILHYRRVPGLRRACAPSGQNGHHGPNLQSGNYR